MSYLHIALLTLAGIWVAYVGFLGFLAVRGVVRFIQASPQTRRNTWLRFRVWVGWRKLTLALDLAKVIRESSRITSRPSLGPALFATTVGRSKTDRKIAYPKAKVRADDYGVVLRVKTLPKVGRAEFEKAAPYLADAWQCVRVQVYRNKPGRLVVRGIRRDPLSEVLELANVPAGVYTDPNPFRPYLGRDEWGQDRYIDLRGITGITVAGLPRYGKTELLLSLVSQWAGTRAVQFVFLDGKGSGRQVGADYEEWVKRAWLASGDDPEHAERILRRVTDHMSERGRVISSTLGVKNGWHIGPTEDWPLIVVVVDECHTFFDEKQANGKAEKDRYLRLQAMARDGVKKSGSVMMLWVFITQKQTSDAIPTGIRDICTVGISFAVRSREAAVAGLGEGIRDAPSLCPTGLRERPTYIGAMVANLPEDEDFLRVRAPHIPEEVSYGYAAASAHLRTDPDELLAALTVMAEPADVPVIEPART